MNIEMIPKPKIPTEEEMIPIAKSWFSILDGVKFTDYNEELNSITYPYRIFKCSKDIIHPIVNGETESGAFKKLHEEFCANIPIDILDCFFIKLITRSPKDFLYDRNNFGKPKPLTCVNDAVTAIANSMRTAEDMCMLYYLDEFTFVVRPYMYFHPKNEWRVFIKDGKINGISQYYYAELFENINADGIAGFVNEKVIPHIKVKSFVADIVKENGFWLLETNPYGFSDPCLFRSYENLDGSTKIN